MQPEATHSIPKHRCEGVRKDGSACQAAILVDGRCCFAHCNDAKERRLAAVRKGGRNKANRVRLVAALPDRLASVLDLLTGALDDVHTGRITPGQGSAMGTIARAIVAVLEAGEMEQRLARLESEMLD